MAEEAATAAAQKESNPGAPTVKVRKLRQRACDEKDAKGKVCNGHLKRWYDFPKEIEALVGGKVELYRCENCKALYRPNLQEMPRSYTQRY